VTTTIPDLWSNDIKADVLPPVAVLKAQEGLLARKTKGMLQAEVSTLGSGGLVQHQFDLLAPGLNWYRARVLTATHDAEMLYPVMVTSEAFESPRKTGLNPALLTALDPSRIQRQAATDEDFIELVRIVLQSDRVRSLISSLLARMHPQPSQSPVEDPVPPSQHGGEATGPTE